ncbi:hypothetical protein HNR62_000346 [Oceanisphaera litoralis]|uniref:gp33 family protein n=1 Tax=Oceanisphaera litoralis TaxID=225144 RepID=UPI001958153D|nr:hypothetical protein [Oceanisphaera litoralis]MBM7454517.1 hypothetical protein [Oceanisphaera litoralis]
MNNELMTALFEAKKALDDANKAAADAKKEYDTLAYEVLASLQEAGIDKTSVRGLGTVSWKTETVANVEDWESFYHYIRDNDAFYLLQRRPANNAVRELWEQGADVPGAVPFTQAKLSVTKAR